MKNKDSDLKQRLTNIHGARATDSLPAGPSERQAGVHLVLDLDQGVQDHGATVVEVHLVVLHLWLVTRLLRVPPVDSEGLLLLGPQAPGSLLLGLAGRGGGGSSPEGEVDRGAGGEREQLRGGVDCHDSLSE